MSSTKTQTVHKPAGQPDGGQFARTQHSDAVPALAAVTRVPSQASLYAAIYEDRPSNGERRGLGRTAVEQTLEGDDFNVVFTDETRSGIRAEAERDDSMDRALGRLPEGTAPHHLGDALARDLITIREKRLAVESHYVPTASDTFHAAAVHISGSAENYEKVLKETFPHAGPWMEQMMTNHRLQPESWQRGQLSKLATSNEMAAAFNADRPIVSEEENPDFTSHPVTALESRIDGLIAHRGDPTCDENIRFLAGQEGAGYGTVNIKILGRKRLEAWRHTPIEAM